MGISHEIGYGRIYLAIRCLPHRLGQPVVSVESTGSGRYLFTRLCHVWTFDNGDTTQGELSREENITI